MKIGLNTDGFGAWTIERTLDRMAELKMEAVEFALGGWSSAPHVKIDSLLSNAAERDRLLGLCRERGLTISALNCSGNQLHSDESGSRTATLAYATVELAKLLEVDRIVMMSGLPPAPGDSFPNWITSNWPPETQKILEWQWSERVAPFWKEFAPVAEKAGVRICIEQIARQAVHNNETFFRLRGIAGRNVGVNFDPSHLIWMGGDPVAAIEELGECVFHVHGKDTYIEAGSRSNGLLDPKDTTPVKGRAWNYVSLGHGTSYRRWLDILAALKRVGYDDVVSIENEDYSLDPDTAITTSNAVLRFSLDSLAG